VTAGTDGPFAKLAEPITQRVDSHNILIDRENQQLTVKISDIKLRFAYPVISPLLSLSLSFLS
jgi:hypothetical protein